MYNYSWWSYTWLKLSSQDQIANNNIGNKEDVQEATYRLGINAVHNNNAYSQRIILLNKFTRNNTETIANEKNSHPDRITLIASKKIKVQKLK